MSISKLVIAVLLLHLAAAQETNQCKSYNGATYPDPRSCYNYYQCYNGVSVRRTCSFGMVYNCFLKTCTPKAFAPCCRYDPNPPPTSNGCLNWGLKVPNPFLCNKYFECLNWKIVEKTCVPGKKFDFLKLSCVDSNGCRCAPGTVIDNSTITTTPPENENCPEGVTYPDTSNCQRFYKCQNGIPQQRICRFGLVYNCALKSCTFRSYTPCCKYDKNRGKYGTDSCFGFQNLKIPNPFECDKYFQCNNFKIKEYTCPAGEKFDWIKMDCVDANGCHCAPGSQGGSTTTPQGQTTFHPTTWLIGTETQTAQNLIQTTNPSTAPSTFTDTTTSTTIGKTSTTTPPTTVLFTTPSTTQTTYSTALPSTAPITFTDTTSSLTSITIETTSTTNPPTTTLATTSSTTQTTYSTTLPTIYTSPITSVETSTSPTTSVMTTSIATSKPSVNQCGRDGETYPDTTNCKDYYQCSNGQLVKATCPFGLVYNCFLKVCTLRAFTPCCWYDNSSPPSDNSCFDLDIKIPNPFRCDKYYECINNQIISKYCPYEQKFDWIYSKCVDAKGCHCAPWTNNTSVVPITTTPAKPRSLLCPYDGIKFTDTTSCNSYYQCRFGQPVRRECPFGMVYNCFWRTCTFRIFAPCCRYQQNQPPNDDTCLGIGIKVPNPFDCRKYFQCVDLKIVEKTCQKGTKYDWLRMNCVGANCQCVPNFGNTTKPISKKCPYDGITFPDTTTCRNYYQCINRQPVKKTCPFGLVFNCFLRLCTLRAFTPCCKYDPTLPPYDNSCLSLNVKVPNPFECNKYYQCKGFKITQQTCPIGKKYDWLKANCVNANGCHCAPGT